MKELLLSHAGEPANKVMKMKKKLQAKHEKGRKYEKLGCIFLGSESENFKNLADYFHFFAICLWRIVFFFFFFC